MRPTGEEATRQVLRRMLSGAGGGLSDQVQPIVKPALQARTVGWGSGSLEIVVWSYPNVLVGGPLHVLPAPVGFTIDKFGGRLTTASTSGDVEVTLEKNGSTVATLTFAQDGVTATPVTGLAVTFTEDTDLLGTRITSPGLGATGLAVYARVA